MEKLWDLPPAEQSSSERSSSPSPGDTLPWNLPKHQRVKRSRSASGEVLDPAERAVIRIAGELQHFSLHVLMSWNNMQQSCRCLYHKYYTPRLS
ncbi:microtubule-actin cross-linking factor 1-like [Sinocyclocheilus grahami]|uniref:microtubule-actin cross-linking factor 1-like n=1 Tax=Sinocyclocheilus grahami TaxID=75366 RepID=UPI0007ACE440|nr:PREDICTED: microtubule-actin cross-linking factor 1-like [Sinocyclocheilus grahami]